MEARSVSAIKSNTLKSINEGKADQKAMDGYNFFAYPYTCSCQNLIKLACISHPLHAQKLIFFSLMF